MKEFEGEKSQPKKPPPEKTEAPAPAEAPPASQKAAAVETVPSSPRRGFHVEGLRLRLLPLFWTILAIVALPVFAQVMVDELFRYVPMPGRLSYKWMSEGYDRVGLAALTLAIIFFLKFRRRTDFGLRWPKSKWYLGSAVFWGLLFGAVAVAVEYNGSLISQIAPNWHFRLPSTTNIVGWILLQGIVVGPSEELLLRGLLSTYLASRLEGRIVLGRFDLSLGSVLVAVIVALTYTWNFVAHNVWVTTGQVFYVLLSGIFFAYWFERSKSLLAPVVGHSIVRMMEYAAIFFLIAMWH